MISPRKGRIVRLSAYGVITLLALANTIRHMMEQTRPIDWVMLAIEAAVLLLIAYEIYVGVKERKKAKQRAGIVETRVTAIREMMSKGQNLLRSQPPFVPPQPLALWVNGVDNWTEQTKNLLRSYSAHAEMTFLQHPTILVNSYGSNPKPHVYGSLEHRLNNLRNIMEKPDVYF
jgi:hypothetical protein